MLLLCHMHKYLQRSVFFLVDIINILQRQNTVFWWKRISAKKLGAWIEKWHKKRYIQRVLVDKFQILSTNSTS